MPLAMHGALVDMLRWKNPRARSPHSKVGPTHVFMLPHTGSSWDYSRQQVGNSLRAGVTDEVLWKRSRVRGTSGREWPELSLWLLRDFDSRLMAKDKSEKKQKH